MTLRCTAKLLKRLRLPVHPSSSTPTTKLGDWTAHLLFARHGQIVLCVSERTLLPVLLPGRDIATLIPRFREAVRVMLDAIGVPAEKIQRELDSMAEVAIGKTNSRRVLGSLNDFVRLAESFLGDVTSLLDVSLRLADAPCSPIGMESPRRATLRAFATGE